MTDLSRYKELYDQGDKTQILLGLWWCVFFNEPIPPWLGEAFQNAYRAKTEYKIKLGTMFLVDHLRREYDHKGNAATSGLSIRFISAW